MNAWTIYAGCAALLLMGCAPAEGPSAVDGSADALDAGPTDAAAGGDVRAPVADVAGDTGPPAPELPTTPDPPESCIALTPDAADPTEALFDPACVLDVLVEMAPADWYALRHQTRTLVDIVAGDCHAEVYPEVFDWFEADVVVAGQSLDNVGIRKKGFFGSLSADKPSLKIRFDKYEDDQELAGLDRITLNNVIQDPSLVNACLGYQVMVAAGVPAPRCNFARVVVNGWDLGIYVHVDSIKKPFLARHFTSDEGNLYEATLSDFRPEFRGTWEKKTNRTEDDWSDLDAAVDALAAPDAELMVAAAAVFDLDAFYTFWAAEVLVAHWDGHAGNLNNHYIYADPVDGLFRFIPWGVDSAFLNPTEFIGVGGSLPDAVYAFGHLARRLYLHPEGRAAYVARMVSLMETVWDADALVAEVDRMEALLADHLTPPERQDVASALDVKRGWIQGREAALLGELEGDPPTWSYPPRETFCWPADGAVSGTFDTTWGTSGWNYLQQVGTIEHDLSFFGPLGNIAANARDGFGPTEGLAIVELVARDLEGDNIALVMTGPPELLLPDTSIPIDWQSFSGVIGRFEVLDLDFQFLGAMLDGVLSFEVVSTYLGERVTGSFSAEVIAVP